MTLLSNADGLMRPVRVEEVLKEERTHEINRIRPQFKRWKNTFDFQRKANNPWSDELSDRLIQMKGKSFQKIYRKCINLSVPIEKNLFEWKHGRLPLKDAPGRWSCCRKEIKSHHGCCEKHLKRIFLFKYHKEASIMGLILFVYKKGTTGWLIGNPTEIVSSLEEIEFPNCFARLFREWRL